MKKTIVLNTIKTNEEAQQISQVLHDVWGIRKVEVHQDTNQATISYNEKAASIQDFQQALTDVGFEIKNEEGPIKQ